VAPKLGGRVEHEGSSVASENHPFRVSPGPGGVQLAMSC
jgi:hypothetical protein